MLDFLKCCFKKLKGPCCEFNFYKIKGCIFVCKTQPAHLLYFPILTKFLEL
jgi:hypothetical protein